MHSGDGRPQRPHVDLAGLSPGRLEVGIDLEGARINGDCSGIQAPDVRALECELADVVADDARLCGGHWAECRWRRVQATVIDLADSVLRDILWEEGRFGAVELNGSTLTRVLIRGCKLGYINLRHAKVTDLTVADCVVGELDIAGAQLKRVQITGSEVGRLALSGSRSEHVDISSAQLSHLDGVEALSGVVVSEAQAMDLAPTLVRHLGGRVLDP